MDHGNYDVSFHPAVTLSEQEGVCGYLAFAGALELTRRCLAT